MSTVVIDRRRSNALLFGSVTIAWIAVAAVVEAALGHDLNRQPSWQGWLTLLVAGAFFVGVLAWLIGYPAIRLACRAEFGADVSFSTWLVERRLAWNEIGRVVFKAEGTPVVNKFTLKFAAVDGTCFDVYTNKTQADALRELIREQPLAAGWPGLPLGLSTCWALVGLGTIAVLVGVGFAVGMWLELQNAGVPPAGIAKGLLLAFGIPAAGLAGIGLGGFHLVRRPIVLRPGVIEVKAGDATNTREFIGGLFGRFD
jgi:hypothetical protein